MFLEEQLNQLLEQLKVPSKISRDDIFECYDFAFDNANELLKNNANQDDINELKSEILYIKKQISQKLGIKEVESQEKIRRKTKGAM